jgi:hypothetical protein
VSEFSIIFYLREYEMSKFFCQNIDKMSRLDSPFKIQENPIQCSMEIELCESSLELEDDFEIFEHI